MRPWSINVSSRLFPDIALKKLIVIYTKGDREVLWLNEEQLWCNKGNIPLRIKNGLRAEPKLNPKCFRWVERDPTQTYEADTKRLMDLESDQAGAMKITPGTYILVMKVQQPGLNWIRFFSQNMLATSVLRSSELYLVYHLKQNSYYIYRFP